MCQCDTPTPARISRKIFPQEFPARFATEFPAKFSRKNFLQEFPTRISHKIFPSWILIGWLPITLFQMLNFHQLLPFLNWLFSLLLVLQEVPTRISCKIFPQDFPTRISCKIFPQKFPARISCKIFPQDFPTRFSHKIFPSWILIGWLPLTLLQILNFHQSLPFLNWLFPSSLSHKIFLQEFPARFSRKVFPQDFLTRFFPSWILIGWLPITLFQMLNFHQSLPC